jgi:type I restriction enzyme S subunit
MAEHCLVALASSTTIAILDSEVLRNMPLAIPPLPEQTAIVEYLDGQTAKLDAAVAAARLEIELLREFRERLIADVVTGKVDVREVAAQLPDEPPEEEAELMDTDEIAESEGTDDDAAAEALPEEGVGA